MIFFSTIRFASGNRLAWGTLESCWLHPWYTSLYFSNCFVLPIQNTMYFNNSYKYTCNFFINALSDWLKKITFYRMKNLDCSKWKKKYQLGHTNILNCSSDPARSYLNKTSQITSLLITHMQEILRRFLFYFRSIFRNSKSFNLLIRNKKKYTVESLNFAGVNFRGWLKFFRFVGT